MKHRSITTQLIVRVCGSTMILFVAILAVSYYYSKKEVIRGIEEHSRNLAQYYAERFAGEFQQAATIARTLAVTLEADPFDSEEELRQFMRRELAAAPEVYGTCLAFEPYAFDPSLRDFAPYYYRSDQGLSFRQLGNRDYDYFQWDWYQTPIRTGQPFWSEPYLDEGGGETLMLTYAHPFIRNGKPGGVATIDIGLTELAREVNAIRVLESGYGFIVSSQGRYITFPDETKIMKSTLDQSRPELWKAMAQDRSGFIEAKDPYRGHNSWIVFYTIESARLTIGIVYPVTEALSRVYDFEKTILWLGLIGLFCLMLIVALASKSIASPIVTLAEAAHRVSSGDLNIKLPTPRTHDEVGQLTEAFNTMVRELNNHLIQLQKTTAERERIESELSIAREIQLSMLPTSFCENPDLAGCDLFGRSQPARQVGGDFFDFFRIDDERVGIVIGDVSGKGIPAALFMALCMTLLKATAQRGESPDACLDEVNRRLCPENRKSMFVTVFYGIYRAKDGLLEYCNGGHLPPLLIVDKAIRPVEERGGMALGVIQEATYRAHCLTLPPGSTLFLYTDGITEAIDDRQNEFSRKRLFSLLESMGAQSPRAIIERVLNEVKEFAGDQEPFDDLTALVLRAGRKPGGQGMGQKAVFELAADVKEIPLLAERVSEFLAGIGCPKKEAFAIFVSLEELIVNVISYGYDAPEGRRIFVEIVREEPGRVLVTLIDDGRPFDPVAQAPQPVLEGDVESRAVGGLGLHMARSMTDEIRYRRDGEKNITTLIKTFKAIS